MLPVLGTGVNTAYIYDRRGEQRLLELPKVAAIEWGRAQSAVSPCQVSLLAEQCPGNIGDVHSWAHSIVVYRDDGSGIPERVWEGPIGRIEESPGSVVLTAGDVVKWTTRRAVVTARAGTFGAADEMVWSLGQAFALDDPNVLAHLQQIGGSGPAVPRDVAAYSGMHDADLSSLTGAGARYTALGRSIIVFTDDTPLGSLRPLVPEDHLLVGVTIVEDGDSLGTRTIVRDDAGNVSAAGGLDAYYGLVDLLASAGTGATGSQDVRADALYARSYPTPLQVVIPDGAQLACGSPFPISSLVPGMLWPVTTTTATGRTLSMTCQLASVKVTQAAGTDEKVTVTLVPVSAAAVG